ncbi:MAG: DNA repair protein RadC, partial [Lachnospiraceae bacterium]|nr:DNA repair protein RadC [Lachnospiraceae bacterium]
MKKENKDKICMKELPPDERPYEKCFKRGAEILSDAELIAVIIKTGTESAPSLEVARKVLEMPDGTTNILALQHRSVASLMKVPGIGMVKAVTLKCVAEIAKRTATAKFTKGIDFRMAADIASYYGESIKHLDVEKTKLICLNASNRPICDEIVSSGLVNQTLISAREIFKIAIENGAVRIVLMHNHPGGNPTPSRQDLEMTEQLKEAGHLMNIELLDHII